MQEKQADTFAFTQDQELMDKLRVCLDQIKDRLSSDAYVKLEKMTFLEFQTMISATEKVTGKKRSEVGGETPDPKAPRTGYFNKGKRIIVWPEILSTFAR